MRQRRELIEFIQDGCFSHHLSITPKPLFIPFQNIWVRASPKTHLLLHSYYSHLEQNREHRVVYRGLRLDRLHSTFLHHPLPFSTSLSLPFVKDWVSFTYDTSKLFIILCIYLPKNIPILPFDLPEDVEQEINLPPGQLILTRKLSSDGPIVLYSCKYVPYSSDDILTFFKEIKQ